MLFSFLINIFVLKFDFEKGVFLTKIHYYMEMSGKGLLNSYQQASSLMGHQTNHRINMFLSYKTNSHHESDYKCIYIVIKGKTSSVL